ncbi:phosphotransferase [Nonomuraea purpurea]|uniref:Phosphotransferase n=1 Tax=Nonomuraea purpurea TaxID=1849276 RepID=A0ABV8GGZ5_9ACTN
MTHTEIEITAELVRDLLRDQHPDLADRPVRLGALGWANQLWRLGDDLAVRLPWVGEIADELLLKEHTWLPAPAPRLPLPVPVPQRLGEPSPRFPRPWIVTTWVPGEPADRAPVTRGAGPALWLHGDLHPANVLTADGALCGVVDFGALFAGDPAVDLAAAWTLLPDGAADLFYAAYQPTPDAATRRRARGWAVIRALVGLHVGDAGVHGRPGGKATWGPPAQAALRRLIATAHP